MPMLATPSADLPAVNSREVAPPVYDAAGVRQLATSSTPLDAASCAAEFIASYRSASTRGAYAVDLRRWAEFLDLIGVNVLDAKRADVEGWIRAMEADGLAPATQARRVATVSGFYERAQDDGLIARSPVGRVRRPSPPRTSQTLGVERPQVVQLLREAKAAGNRTYALVALLATTGARISEVLDIDLADLGEERGHRVVRLDRSKGHEVQSVPLPPVAVAAVDALTAGMSPGPLFRTSGGKRLDRQAAAKTVRRLARKAGLEEFGPHALRHSFATSALDSGAAIRDVAAALGHRDVNTTMRYDRSRGELDRSPVYAVAAALA